MLYEVITKYMAKTFCILCVAALMLVENGAAATPKTPEQEYMTLNIPRAILADVIHQRNNFV